MASDAGLAAPQVTFETDDVLGIVEAAEPDSASLFGEAVVDARAFATAVLRLQRARMSPFRCVPGGVLSGRS